MAAQAHSYVLEYWNKFTGTNNIYVFLIYYLNASTAVESNLKSNTSVKIILRD